MSDRIRTIECLYGSSDRVLFIGDSIQGRGTLGSDISLIENVDDYLSYMKG